MKRILLSTALISIAFAEEKDDLFGGAAAINTEVQQKAKGVADDLFGTAAKPASVPVKPADPLPAETLAAAKPADPLVETPAKLDALAKVSVDTTALMTELTALKTSFDMGDKSVADKITTALETLKEALKDKAKDGDLTSFDMFKPNAAEWAAVQDFHAKALAAKKASEDNTANILETTQKLEATNSEQNAFLRANANVVSGLFATAPTKQALEIDLKKLNRESEANKGKLATLMGDVEDETTQLSEISFSLVSTRGKFKQQSAGLSPQDLETFQTQATAFETNKRVEIEALEKSLAENKAKIKAITAKQKELGFKIATKQKDLKSLAAPLAIQKALTAKELTAKQKEFTDLIASLTTQLAAAKAQEESLASTAKLTLEAFVTAYNTLVDTAIKIDLTTSSDAAVAPAAVLDKKEQAPSSGCHCDCMKACAQMLTNNTNKDLGGKAEPTIVEPITQAPLPAVETKTAEKPVAPNLEVAATDNEVKIAAEGLLGTPETNVATTEPAPAPVVPASTTVPLVTTPATPVVDDLLVDTKSTATTETKSVEPVAAPQVPAPAATTAFGGMKKGFLNDRDGLFGAKKPAAALPVVTTEPLTAAPVVDDLLVATKSTATVAPQTKSAFIEAVDSYVNNKGASLSDIRTTFRKQVNGRQVLRKNCMDFIDYAKSATVLDSAKFSNIKNSFGLSGASDLGSNAILLGQIRSGDTTPATVCGNLS